MYFTVTKQTDDAKDDESSGEDDEADMMNRSFKETSLPGTAVAQSSLPAATKASDAKQTKSAVETDVEGSGEDDDETSGSETTDTKEDENANKPSKVKSKIHVEKDKNKIAETVKKSKVTKKGANKAGKKTTSADQSKQEAEKEGKKATKGKENKILKTEMSKKVDDKKSKKTADKKSKKPSKPAHHHHHHHHHHHKQNTKKSNAKRPTVDNEANKPKIDYPTFNWTKDGNKVQKVAQIPGWGSNGINNMAPAGMAQANMVQMSIAQAYATGQMPAVKRDNLPMKLSTDLLNNTVKNQADIARIDQASTETESISSPKNQMAAAQPINAAPASNSTTSSNVEATDSAKDPVSATIASDTGEVPSNIRKKAELKIPKTVPSRCVNLVKSYTNAELTLRDYLKQMRKCKRADAEFNSLHGNAMLRDAISKNGPYLTKEAYKYALERVRNYVPSSKEKEAADMILAKWRSNSFGTRDKISKNGDVPDAIKSFMTGQTAKEAAAQSIQEQTQKAIDTAKSYILGTITGRPAEVPATGQVANEGSDTEKKATIVTSTSQNVVNVINAAKALLTGDNKGHAILLSHGSDVPAVLPLPGTKKEDIASPVEKKAKALEMAKTADVLNAAMMSQLSPNIVTNSEKVSTNLVAALRDMASGPETAEQQGLKPSLQKRSARMTLKANSRRKRSASNDASITYNKLFKIKRSRRQTREKSLKIDNPSERSKLNKPIVAAPKLMDKIRDMSMVIATP
eukprot:gene12802-3541_t